MFPKGTYYSCLVAYFCLLVALSVRAQITPSEAQESCMKRTGLDRKDMEDVMVKNEGCAVDCIMKSAEVFTIYSREGESCHDRSGYRCVQGRCRGPEEKSSDNNELYEVELIIKRAHVPDLDSMVVNGESDAFVVVTSERNGEPMYKRFDTVCYTNVIQDNVHPIWNFSCKPSPLRLDSKLKFSVYDSDKPMQIHDKLGSAIETVDYLLNKGPKMLPLIKGDRNDLKYWIEVEMKGNKYSKDE